MTPTDVLKLMRGKLDGFNSDLLPVQYTKTQGCICTCTYVYMYIYIHILAHMYIYIYLYIHVRISGSPSYF